MAEGRLISGTGSKEEGEGGLLEERRMYCTNSPFYFFKVYNKYIKEENLNIIILNLSH